MVTSFMLVYNKSSSSSSAPSVAHRSDGHGPGLEKPERPQRLSDFTLDGYTGVMDHTRLKMHCGTCALVASSGHLTGSERGEDIDRSECVIRMNDAPSLGHQRDVGRRTSLRVVAHSSLQRVLWRRQQLLNASQDTVFIFWGPSSCMRRDGKGQVYNKLRLLNQVLPKLKGYIISQIKMLKFDELFKKETGRDRKSSNSWLSTGWFTMAIALELCDRINVFGMVPPDFCRSSSQPSVPYHYYEPSGPEECAMYLTHEQSRRGSHHRFITEKTVFAKWAQTLNIHFYQPDWEPAAAVVKLGTPAVAEALLSAGADPNLPDPVCSLTVTHDAARDGFVDTVRVLLAYEADVNLVDAHGNLPLHLAAREGHLEAVKLLIGRTADPQRANRHGYTAHQLALSYNRPDTAEYITEYLNQ